MRPATRLIAGMCVAEVAGMIGNASFAALLPRFVQEWSLTNSAAGWIDGLFFAGYVISVPVLTSLTDRIDPRRVYLASAVLAGLAALGFALTAHGFWSAAGWRVLAGIGLAGTYMPGLKALNDRLGGAAQTRAVAFYTASFGIGLSASYFVTGETEALWGWRAAFYAAAAGAALSVAVAAVILEPRPADIEGRPPTRLLDFRPVLRNRPAMGYVLGYAAHAWELFGLRSWAVAFLTFAAAAGSASPSAGETWLKPTLAVTVIMLLGMPASILGNEMSLRIGRRRAITAIMVTGGVVGTAMGFAGGLGYGVAIMLAALYTVLVTGDSASLTAGMVQASDPAYRGATMAVHSTVGFAGAVVSPPLVGLVLDLAGGRGQAMAWGLAFLTVTVMGFLGPLVLAWGRRAEGQPRDLPGPAV
jgi:MFS family permease